MSTGESRSLAIKRQRAGRAHGLRLLDEADHRRILARGDEVLDLVAEIMDRNVDGVDARSLDLLQHAVEHRTARDRDQRLRRGLGEIAEPLAEPAGHDQRPRQRQTEPPRDQHMIEPALRVDHGQEPGAVHENAVGVILAAPAEDRRRAHALADRIVERRALEDRAPQIAVGHRAEHLAIFVDHDLEQICGVAASMRASTSARVVEGGQSMGSSLAMRLAMILRALPRACYSAGTI